MKDKIKKYSEALLQYRQAHSISQKEMAKLLGISNCTIVQIELLQIDKLYGKTARKLENFFANGCEPLTATAEIKVLSPLGEFVADLEDLMKTAIGTTKLKQSASPYYIISATAIEALITKYSTKKD